MASDPARSGFADCSVDAGSANAAECSIPSDKHSAPCRGSRDPRHAMHTTEHMLNAVMQREFGASRSIEAHFGSKKSKCDYIVPRPLDEADLERIEATVNAEIEKDLAVTTFEIPRAEAEGRYDMGKVPESARSIRIVEIGDLDVIPCVGDHVEHTHQIGRFVIRSATMRDERTVRIRYALEQQETSEVDS